MMSRINLDGWIDKYLHFPGYPEGNEKQIGVGTIFLILFLYLILLVASLKFLDNLLNLITKETGGWLQGWGIFSITANLLFIYCLLHKVKNLSANSLGIHYSKIWTGIVLFSVSWFIIQAIEGVSFLLSEQHLVFNQIWHSLGVPYLIGYLFYSVFGHVLWEEIIFRGFLITQLFLYFSNKVKNRKFSLVAAIVLSTSLFALFHIPVQLFTGSFKGFFHFGKIDGFFDIFWFGFVLSLLYVRTGNTYLLIAFHTLYNCKLSLFPLTNWFLIYDILILFVFFWVPNAWRYRVHKSCDRKIMLKD